MRITNNMIRRNYQSNLNSSLTGLDQARNQVETGRRFTQSYQDPVAATKANLLENRYSRNADYLNATLDTTKWLDVQEDVLTEISEISKEVDMKYSMEALNATNEAGLDAYAATFRELQRSMINILNVKYADSYVMAGQDAEEAPFVMEADGTVTFRGIDVNTTDAGELAILDEFAKETAYVDLGFGLSFDAAGEIVPSSALDAALPGIKAVGYGQTADGTPENLIVLLGEMADVLDAEPLDRDAYVKLWDQFGESANDTRNAITEIGTKAQLLEATEVRLENEKLSITEQFDDTVNIDPAEAITNFTYADYVYNASLKVGMNILTPSLLDFMQ